MKRYPVAGACSRTRACRYTGNGVGVGLVEGLLLEQRVGKRVALLAVLVEQLQSVPV
jgi:hypothetical protein